MQCSTGGPQIHEGVLIHMIIETQGPQNFVITVLGQMTFGGYAPHAITDAYINAQLLFQLHAVSLVPVPSLHDD